MHLRAFIAIFVPKLVAMVTPLCPLCMGVSQMNSPMAQTLSQNQTLHGCVAYNWSYGQFCEFLAYFGQNLVAMATSLRPLQSEMSSLDWSTTKTPVLSNYILVISRRNAFVCIYSNFCPQIGCHVTPLCPLCTGVSQMNSPIAQTLSQNQTLHGCVAYNWSYGHFCDFLAYFGQNLVAMATPLRASQSQMASSDWPTPKTIPWNQKFCQ